MSVAQVEMGQPLVLRYKKKFSKTYLLMGIAFVLFGIANLIIQKTVFIGLGYIVVSLLYLVSHYFQNKHQYATITNGILERRTGFKTKRVNLNELIRIKKFAGDYTFISASSEVVIDTQRIEESSKVALDDLVDQLELSL